MNLESKPNQSKKLVDSEPNLYGVILHNDDFTPIGFVVVALHKFFNKDREEAQRITIEAHTKGRAVCGVYTKEIAETRIDQATEFSVMHDHPLRWSLEVV